MARDLGSFGVESAEPQDADYDDFGWFGARIRVQSSVNEVELIDLMGQARVVDVDGRDLGSLAVVKDLFLLVIHPDDFDQFWGLARQHKQRLDDMLSLFTTLIESITDRPTQGLSDSSPGQPSTAENSLPDSSGSASSGPPERHGRPDLQIIHDDHTDSQRRALAALATG